MRNRPAPLQFVRLLLWSALCLSSIGLTGCFGKAARWLADHEVYPMVANRNRTVLGETRDFTIDQREDEMTARILAEAPKAADEFTTSGLTIGLFDALSLAVVNSRDYQTEKENLYLVALDLTESRHSFSPIFTGFVSDTFTRDWVPKPTPLSDPSDPLSEPSDDDPGIDTQRSATVNAGIAMSWIFVTGGQITLALSNTFIRQLTGSPDETESGLISGTFIQPLLRNNPLLGGAGFQGTLEQLRQSERDLIYQVRDFARFERSFIVDRINEYYRLLQALDVVANERANYDSLTLSRERSEFLGEAGRLDSVQVDQARQDELSARNRWIDAQTQFMQQLDLFKLNLGIPTDLQIMPNPAELAALTEKGLPESQMGLSEAVDRALEFRLDYDTAVQESEDAERRLKIAENNLLPDLDITGDLEIEDDGRNKANSFEWRKRRYNIRAELELPLDRKAERNAYRRSLIALERALRNEGELRDTIVREVRSAYQAFENARLSYEIQVRSLEVANRRVDSTQLFLEAGRATIRDVLEAQESQLSARNSLTRSVIDYTIARLRFLVAIEALSVDDRGLWHEGPTAAETNLVANPAPAETSVSPEAVEPAEAVAQ